MKTLMLDIAIFLVWTWGVCRLMLYVIPETVKVKEYIVCSHLGSVVVGLLLFGLFSAGSDAQTAVSFLLVAVPFLCLADVLGHWQSAGEDHFPEAELLTAVLPAQSPENGKAEEISKRDS